MNDFNDNKKKLALFLKTKFVKNVNEIFKNKKINLVSIASFDNYHFDHLYKAIKNGKIYLLKTIMSK